MVLLAGQLLLATAAVLIAGRRFRGRFVGFGLRWQSWGKTVWPALVIFFVATGLALLTLWLTVTVCREFGYNQTHRNVILDTLCDNPPARTVGLLILSAVAGAPLQEELLFRGVLQSYLIKAMAKPPAYQSLLDVAVVTNHGNIPPTKGYHRWLGIVATSAIFAMFHNWQHAPALMVFSICLGYAYERYGSLLIPIIVHCLFNTLHIAMTLVAMGTKGVNG
ncbi:MAG: lysostaphin resistance A-like protein [Alphaproteobacteria bacterium]